MARAQNSAKGRFQKTIFQVPAAGSLLFEAYSTSTGMVSGDSTGLVLTAGIKLSSKANAVITGNATGIVLVGGARFSAKANATVTGNTTGIIILGGARFSNKGTAVITGNATGIVLNGGIRISNKGTAVITGNSTGLVLTGGVKISNKQTLTANSTGYISTVVAAKPSARSAAKLAFYTNSTGINALMVNTTGTTWKFLRATATLNGTSGY